MFVMHLKRKNKISDSCKSQKNISIRENHVLITYFDPKIKDFRDTQLSNICCVNLSTARTDSTVPFYECSSFRRWQRKRKRNHASTPLAKTNVRGYRRRPVLRIH